jgi:hypothetical protein
VGETLVLDRVLKPLHRWIWSDPRRRAQKLLSFSLTEAAGGKDLTRAAELTRDPILRTLLLRHASDEQRHAELFRTRGRALRAAFPGGGTFEANWLSPGERGFDELRVDGSHEDSLMAFLHLSEKAAAERFAVYGEVLDSDPQTREIFARVLEDESFHMHYTRRQLARLAPRKQGLRLWQARAGRLWKAYLRFASGLASVMAAVVLAVQYFLLLPPFALLAKRNAGREGTGFHPSRKAGPLGRQY